MAAGISMTPDATHATSVNVPVQFALYALMCGIWGSSFFFTSIALRSFNEVSLPAFRMMLATMALALIVGARRLPLPRDKRIWGHALALGFFNIAFPYVLLTWAQLHINSSTASILSSTTPLFVFLFSCLVVRTERFGLLRALGLGIAFLGIVILYGAGKASAASIGPWSLVIVLCSMFYAAGNVYTRQFMADVHPFIVALLQIGFGAALLLGFGLATGTLVVHAPDAAAWLSLAELGLAGSAVTYLLFFHFIRQWGSTVTSLNTYFQPLVGLTLGVAVLHDNIPAMGWAALGTVLFGIALFGLGTWRLRRTVAQPSTEIA